MTRATRSASAMETPPLTRGRQTAKARIVHAVGNTPAYAGKTIRFRIGSSAYRKHPRLRGEDGSKPSFTASTAETPPLTRGRRSLRILNHWIDGNTPAYAGKTTSRHSKPCRQRETPPLTRGRRVCTNLTTVSIRNTPAYAGKMKFPVSLNVFLRKHPRLRGEDATFCTKTNLTIQNTLLLTDLSVFH